MAILLAWGGSWEGVWAAAESFKDASCCGCSGCLQPVLLRGCLGAAGNVVWRGAAGGAAAAAAPWRAAKDWLLVHASLRAYGCTCLAVLA